MKICFLNQKGGVGKSTTSMLIASALKAAECSVKLCDKDPQQSLTWWAENVGDIPLINEEFSNDDIIITDTAGHLNLDNPQTKKSLEETIKGNDRLILVSELSPLSLQATAPMAALIKKNLKPSAKAYILFNKVRQNTVIGMQDQRSLAKDFEIKPLKNFLPLSSAYEQVSAFGWSSVTGKERKMAINLALEILK